MGTLGHEYKECQAKYQESKCANFRRPKNDKKRKVNSNFIRRRVKGKLWDMWTKFKSKRGM